MNPIIFLYYASWGALQGGPTLLDVDGGKITHLCYAYGKPNSIYDFELWEYNADLTFKITAVPTESDFFMNTTVEMQPLKDFKKKYPHVKMGITVKNDDYDDYFQEMISDLRKQERFIGSLCTFMKTNGFDFADVEIGHPTPKDKHNTALFIEMLAKKITERVGKEAFVTLSLPGEVSSLENFDLPRIAKSVSFANVLAFGFTSHGKEVSTHSAPYYAAAPSENSAERAIKHCKANGLQASQLVLGFSGIGPLFGNCTVIGRPFGSDARVRGEHNADSWYYGEVVKNSGQLETKFDDKAGAAYSVLRDKNALLSHESAASINFKLEKAMRDEKIVGASFMYHYQDSLGKDSMLSLISAKVKDIAASAEVSSKESKTAAKPAADSKKQDSKANAAPQTNAQADKKAEASKTDEKTNVKANDKSAVSKPVTGSTPQNSANADKKPETKNETTKEQAANTPAPKPNQPAAEASAAKPAQDVKISAPIAANQLSQANSKVTQEQPKAPVGALPVEQKAQPTAQPNNQAQIPASQKK